MIKKNFISTLVIALIVPLYPQEHRKLNLLVQAALQSQELPREVAEKRQEAFIATPLKESPKGAFFCDKCGKSYASRPNLLRHQVALHNRLPKHNHTIHKTDFTCRFCSRVLKNLATLSRHVILQHQDKCEFLCDKCGTRFLEKQGLKKHIGLKHGKSNT